MLHFLGAQLGHRWFVGRDSPQAEQYFGRRVCFLHFEVGAGAGCGLDEEEEEEEVDEVGDEADGGAAVGIAVFLVFKVWC